MGRPAVFAAEAFTWDDGRSLHGYQARVGALPELAWDDDVDLLAGRLGGTTAERLG